VTEQELALIYEAQKPALLAWGNMVKDAVLSRLTTTLAADRKLSEFLKIPPEPRVKDTDSFLAKALRRRKNYDRPLEQITDMVGIRFIVLLLTELSDFEAEKTERPHHFDYQSIHYVVHPKKPVKSGDVITVPASLMCEIQVRTLLQHAYAELAHNTIYKPSLCLDRDVNRQIAKSSALVEATDEIFIGVHGKIQAASEQLKRIHEIVAASYQKHVGTPLNSDERLTSSLLDPYRHNLRTLSAEALEVYLTEKDFIADRVKERAPLSILYRHPVVLAVYFLVANEPDLVPKQWPADQAHLEMIYSDLGISAEGRLW